MGNEHNPRKGAEFEKKCLVFLEETGVKLKRPFSLPVGVNGYKKVHKFDLGSEESSIVVECKCHTWTNGNNAPSAKMSTWNEAMYYFQACPPGYRKIFFVLKSLKDGQTLSEYYIKRHKELIPNDVEIWEYDADLQEATIVYGSPNYLNKETNKTSELKTSNTQSSEQRQVNRNGQRDLGRSNPPLKGTDHCQYVHIMQCTKCGNIYGANGSDVFQRKCPQCQNGKLGLQLNI